VKKVWGGVQFFMSKYSKEVKENAIYLSEKG